MKRNKGVVEVAGAEPGGEILHIRLGAVLGEEGGEVGAPAGRR